MVRLSDIIDDLDAKAKMFPYRGIPIRVYSSDDIARGCFCQVSIDEALISDFDYEKIRGADTSDEIEKILKGLTKVDIDISSINLKTK